MRRSVWLLVGLIVGWMANLSWAQSEPSTLRLTVARATAGGIHVYAPEKWGLLHINVTNSGSEPRDVTVATYFDTEPTLQYGRRLWVPALSTLHTTQPVLVPKIESDSERTLGYHSLVFDAQSSNEVLIKEEHSSLINDGAILINRSPLLTGFIGDGLGSANDQAKEPYELVVACRLARLLDRRVGTASLEGLPYDEQSLEAISNLVIVGDRLLEDAAAIAAIRRWMFGGGRVWVMLDRVDPRVLELLLGDEASCQIIDRVGLNSVQIDTSTDAKQQPMNAPVEYETPIDLLRVSVSNVEVRAKVNGWPAAFSTSYGHGSLLVTTLGARAWMTPRKIPLKPIEQSSPFEPLIEATHVTSDFFLIRNPEFVPPEMLASEVTDYIGYSIPGRGIVFGFLCGFVVAIGVVGGLLWRADRLERLGWIVPLLGLVCGASLIAIGHFNRHEISAMAATLQVVQRLPGTDDTVTHGLIGTYHPEGSQSQFAATQGGRLVPHMAGMQGITRRMMWTDLGKWHWENVPQNAGQVMVPFSQSTTLSKPIEVIATLGPEGVVGKVHGELAGMSDPVLVTRAERIGINLKSDGEFMASTANVFGPDQFLDAQLLDDEQARRRQVFKKLLSNPQRRDFPSQPFFMVWTPAWNTGLGLSDEYQTQGSALCIFPLRLERPAKGQEFVIPPPLLPFRMVSRPDGRPSSQIYDSRRSEWRESAAYSTAWLRFQAPVEVLPTTILRGRVAIQVSGPIGKLELLGLRDDKAFSIDTLIDPVGTVTFEINDLDALKLDEQGRLRLGLNVGDLNRPELTRPSDPDSKPNYWRIDSLSLTLWGQAIEPSSKE